VRDWLAIPAPADFFKNLKPQEMLMSDDVVIVSAARTPVGSFNGAFATMPAHDLGAVAIKAALIRAGVEPARVSEVIMGQILTAAEGQNPARQASIAAGIPVESPAWGINQLCGSGLRAVALGYQALLNGDSDIVVAGGQESMSMAPHAQHLRGGVKMGSVDLVDTMIKDGLWDAFNGYHMGNTAENVAKQYQITRAQQDEFAVASQNKAEAAMKAGKFKDEIAPVTLKTRKGDAVVDTDEYPKAGVTVEGISKLRPAFANERRYLLIGAPEYLRALNRPQVRVLNLAECFNNVQEALGRVLIRVDVHAGRFAQGIDSQFALFGLLSFKG